MKLKDAASVFGSVGILLPLILIFLIATDAAYACPDTQSRVVYRTKTVNSRMMPMMRTTVISYGGTASSTRCGDSTYVTRPVRYVAVRRAAPTYVAVRSDDSYYPTRRVRYVAARNVDYDDSPRYVVVRRTQPTYVESRRRYVTVRDDDFDDASRYVAVDHYVRDGVRTTRYAAVRSGYRRDNGIVGYVDVNDSPRYVAVRRSPVYDAPTRVVAVRSYDDDDDYIAPPRYVAVRNTSNACACAGELRSSLDDVETVSPRHVVVKSDYIAGTQEVIVPPSGYDDTAYVAVPRDSGNRTYVSYGNASYVDDSDSYYTPASYAVMPRTHTVSYVKAYDDSDLDNDADLDTDNVTYVADNDIGDACLSSVAVQEPMEYHTSTASYDPMSDFDDNATISGSGRTYIVNDDAVSTVRYVQVADEDIDADTMYVASDDLGARCSCPVARRSFDDDADIDTVSYVSSRPANYVPARTVSYAPADETTVTAVSDVDADSVDDVDTADTSACSCPISENTIVAQPAEAADASTAILDDVNNGDTVAVVSDTQAIAGDNGYRNGFEEGKTVALAGDEFRPADSIGFQEATIGNDERFGDMDSYRDQYRSSYLQGYSAGFNSVVSP